MEDTGGDGRGVRSLRTGQDDIWIWRVNSKTSLSTQSILMLLVTFVAFIVFTYIAREGDLWRASFFAHPLQIAQCDLENDGTCAARAVTMLLFYQKISLFSLSKKSPQKKCVEGKICCSSSSCGSMYGLARVVAFSMARRESWD